MRFGFNVKSYFGCIPIYFKIMRRIGADNGILAVLNKMQSPGQLAVNMRSAPFEIATAYVSSLFFSAFPSEQI